MTQKKLVDLRRTVTEKRAQTRPVTVPELIWRGHQNGMLALIADLEAEVEEYDQLKAGTVRVLRLPSVLGDLPGALVRARIARGWTHKDLAQALGTTEQQVQKDESGGYARASLERLQRVARALGIEVVGRVRLGRAARQHRA